MIIRLMGEIDIHSFRADSLLLEQPVISNLKMPDGISDSDMINWLGWALTVVLLLGWKKMKNSEGRLKLQVGI